MITLNKLRLGIVAILSLAAFGTGFLSRVEQQAGLATRSGVTFRPLEFPNNQDLHELIERLRSTGQFPEARTLITGQPLAVDRSTLSAGSDNSDIALGELEDYQTPRISAIYRIEQGGWIVVSGLGDRRMPRIAVGDTLFDGWTVESLNATEITIEKNGSVQTINVIETRGEIPK